MIPARAAHQREQLSGTANRAQISLSRATRAPVSRRPGRHSRPAGSEIPRSWVYWSVAAGLAVGLLAEVWPLPQHGHHMSITDAFDIAWKVALFPPGIVTGRSRGQTFLSAA